MVLAMARETSTNVTAAGCVALVRSWPVLLWATGCMGQATRDSSDMSASHLEPAIGMGQRRPHPMQTWTGLWKTFGKNNQDLEFCDHAWEFFQRHLKS